MMPPFLEASTTVTDNLGNFGKDLNACNATGRNCRDRQLVESQVGDSSSNATVEEQLAERKARPTVTCTAMA